MPQCSILGAVISVHRSSTFDLKYLLIGVTNLFKPGREFFICTDFIVNYLTESSQK
jgi:hypothetical protein